MKIKTVAGEVRSEISKNMSGIYPWQYQDNEIISVNYKAILSDLETYWEQEARYREGFHFDENTNQLYLPNFFTKINGVCKDMTNYKKLVQRLKGAKNTLVLNCINGNDCTIKMMYDKWDEKDKIPFITNSEIANKYLKMKDKEFYDLTIQNLYNGRLFVYTLSNVDNFRKLTTSKQTQLIMIMDRVINDKLDVWSSNDMLAFIGACMSIPSKVCTLINNFDYCYDVPKLIVTENNINIGDALLLYLLNEFCMDIVLLSPSGESTIERFFEINEISLGYFSDDVNVNNIKTEEEILHERNLEISKKKKERKEFWIKIINSVYDSIHDNWISILMVLGCITLPAIGLYLAFHVSGTILLIYGIIGLFIMCFLGYILDQNICLENYVFIWLIVGFMTMIFILAGRFVYYVSFQMDKHSCHTHEGFIDIEAENIEIQVSDTDKFVMHYYDELSVYNGAPSAYGYIENNAENEYTIYFKIIYKNKTIFESAKLESLKYCPKITWSQDLEFPIGEHVAEIKFYKYDAELDNPYTDILLGSGEITIHVFSDRKEVKNHIKEIGLEYCTD